MLKKTIKKVINIFGYEIMKNPVQNDLDLYYLLFKEEDIKNKFFYNIGAGSFNHPFWTNIDYYSEWYRNNEIDIHYDLLKLESMPIKSNTANIVYSSHTIEHITDEAAQNMFNESFRILKKDGIIRIAVPNIDLYYRALINNDIEFWRWEINTYSRQKQMERVKICKPMKDVSIIQLFLYAFATQTTELHSDSETYTISDEEFKKIFREMEYIDLLNYCKSKCLIELQKKYPGNHINWWNKDKLFKMLDLAGFKNVYVSAYGQSLSPILRNINLFDNTHFKQSIYVEAQK